MMNKITKEAKDAMNISKKVVITDQKGRTVLTTVKKALVKSPGLPTEIKTFIENSPYGEYLVAFTINMVIATTSNSDQIKSLGKAAIITAALNVSQEITIIQDTITSIIDGIGNSVNEVLEDVIEDDSDDSTKE